MVVKNPVILAGGRRLALPNQAEQGDILGGRSAYDHLGNEIEGSLVMPPSIRSAGITAGTYRHSAFLYSIFSVVQIDGPMLYLLKPGDYNIENYEYDSDILLQYGMAKGSFDRVSLAGQMLLANAKCLNFVAHFDPDYDRDYLRNSCYMADKRVERSLPLINLNHGMAGISLAPIIEVYADNSYLPTADFNGRDWRLYCSLLLHHCYYREV